MIDREKVLTVLTRRFPGAQPDQLAAAANAIVGLDDEWDEVADASGLAMEVEQRDQFRVFRRRKSGRRL